MRVLLAEWTREVLAVPLTDCRAVGGGCIHNAWELVLADGRRLFAKTNAAAAHPLFQAEAEGLRVLAAVAGADLAIPEPLHCGLVGDRTLLVMEWLALSRSGTTEGWEAFGAGLARLHRRSLGQGEERFGWAHDNVIGSAPQRNRWDADWGRFFTECRLAPQFAWAQERGVSYRGSGSLLAATRGWLNGHGAVPALVHGDLWAGNVGLLEASGALNGSMRATARGALFDPAVYRGDREVDLAMAHLFGGFPAAFFSGYEQEWPLPSGHEQRRRIYNLYHLLNHANLFGDGYRSQAQDCIDRLLSQ
jgi:fructosamine-3-kinase